MVSQIYKKENVPVFLIGDIHGENDQLIQQIKRYDLRDCILICVGDFGVGFHSHKEMARLVYLNRFFNERNIKFKSIRGNHDDPFYYNGKEQVILENLELIEDYTTKKINGEDWLFVGGAISIDRLDRKPNKSYWEGEPFILDISKIQRCDVLITHSAPTWNGENTKSGLMSYIDRGDTNLWDECSEERRKHDILIKLSNPKKHYCGHFHTNSVIELGGCVSRILDILEIVEHR
jgi:hypothetical protein